MWVGFIYKTAGREGKAKAVDSTGVLVLVVGGISFFVFFSTFFFSRSWVFLSSQTSGRVVGFGILFCFPCQEILQEASMVTHT